MSWHSMAYEVGSYKQSKKNILINMSQLPCSCCCCLYPSSLQQCSLLPLSLPDQPLLPFSSGPPQMLHPLCCTLSCPGDLFVKLSMSPLEMPLVAPSGSPLIAPLLYCPLDSPTLFASSMLPTSPMMVLSLHRGRAHVFPNPEANAGTNIARARPVVPTYKEDTDKPTWKPTKKADKEADKGAKGTNAEKHEGASKEAKEETNNARQDRSANDTANNDGRRGGMLAMAPSAKQ
jgi:hypothetical protein